MRPRALINTRGQRVRALVQVVLKREDTDVVVEQDRIRGIELLESEPFDVLVAELRSIDHVKSGVLREAHEIVPSLPVAVISTCCSVESSVSAFQSGAVDDPARPLRSGQVVAALARAFSKTPRYKLPTWIANAPNNSDASRGPVTIVTASSVMKQIAEKCPPIAASNRPILIAGELGVGKQRIVQLIHSLSARRDEPCVTVNCDAMQNGLLVETFFGEEGTNDRAEETHRPGLIERTAGGTLFLRNVTGLPRWMQKKLMQASHAGEFLRQGGSEPIAFRARIAASVRPSSANNANNGALVDALCSHFGMTPLAVPPLRHRQKDILPLADAIVRDVAGDPSLSQRRGRLCVTDEATRLLEAYSWPGNIHELRNFIRRVFVFTAGSVVSAATVHELLPNIPAFRGRATVRTQVSETDR
jgi:DNA-binding NtrC family response regulator